jgi:hypothetical protein
MVLVEIQVENFWVVTLEMKGARSFEALVSYHKSTRLHNPEVLHLNLHRRETPSFSS